MQCWMLTGLTAVITLQYIQISNYYVLHLELIHRHTSFYCTLLYLADNCIFYKWSFVATLHSDSSVGKESACNAGDPSSISGSGRSAGEGIGYPPQYSWASLVAQLVKNLPAMQETWVRSLGWGDLLVKRKATHSNILAWRSIDCIVHGVSKSLTRLSNFHFHFSLSHSGKSWLHQHQLVTRPCHV